MSREQEVEIASLKERLKVALDHAGLMERTFQALARASLGEHGKRGNFAVRVWRAGDINYPIMAVDKPDLIDVTIDLEGNVDATKFSAELTLVLKHLGLRMGETI